MWFLLNPNSDVLRKSDFIWLHLQRVLNALLLNTNAHVPFNSLLKPEVQLIIQHLVEQIQFLLLRLLWWSHQIGSYCTTHAAAAHGTLTGNNESHHSLPSKIKLRASVRTVRCCWHSQVCLWAADRRSGSEHLWCERFAVLLPAVSFNKGVSHSHQYQTLSRWLKFLSRQGTHFYTAIVDNIRRCC